MTSTYSTNPLARLTSASLLLGGVTGAAFVIVSRGEITGALAMLSQRWMIAHNLHFMSAALLLVGLVGLYLAHASRMSFLGHFAFVLALLGTAFHFATGVVTAAVLPFIAGTAPSVMSANGPLFNPPLPALVISVAVFQLGWAAIGAAIARAGLVPAWTGWVTMVGAVVGMIPPRPFGSAPWIVTDIGWVIMAVGLIGMGVSGWAMAKKPALATA